MKRIVKQKSPEWFENWKKNHRTINGREPHYKSDFSTNDTDGANRRKRLRKELVNEQGKICCYCMKRIDVDSSHIEHFYPKEKFQDKDLLYDNLYASCNGEGFNNIYDEHCGHRKDNWWRSDMICLTDIEVEKVFKYSPDGKISVISGRITSNIAQEMINNLGLDSYHLQRSRREAIEASEVFDEQEYSDENIRDFIEYYSNMDNGVYVPFCKAIVDCLEGIL